MTDTKDMLVLSVPDQADDRAARNQRLDARRDVDHGGLPVRAQLAGGHAPAT